MLNKKLLATLICSTLSLTACGLDDYSHGGDDDDDNESSNQVEVSLRILETSDLHSNIMDFNYYLGTDDPTIGLARTASLIDEARNEKTNVVLVDNGDLLQGSPMGDYIAKKGLNSGDTHPAYKAMNTLDYVVGNIGNHEFNYGLDFLKNAISGADFPYINANVYCDSYECWDKVQKGDNLFTPYLIKEKQVLDNKGHKQTIKIGYIGFVPPQIMQWDAQNLQGKVRVDDIVKTAEKFIPIMQKEGADIIIAIPHSGIGSVYDIKVNDIENENATFALTYVEGIDAIAFGHSHAIFPDKQYEGLYNTDIIKGTLNDVPAVMPGRWGDNLGIIDLTLKRSDGKWIVEDSQSESRPIYQDKAQVEASLDIRQAVEIDHLGTLEFVEQPIGKASSNIYSFLSLVQDDPSVQIVSDSQLDKVKQQIANISSLNHLPVLSAAAPFKAGGRHSTTSDSEQYVQVDMGDLTYKNAADLYVYPNTLVALKINGSELKDWLECSANLFNQINPKNETTQQLINWNNHPTYNFDVIDGVTYQIDITQPSKYDSDCQIVSGQENAARIVDLTYTDETGYHYTGGEFAAMDFIVATNNYRAFGEKFAGTGVNNIVLELPDENRDVLARYITAQTSAHGEVTSVADNNWRFKTIATDTTLDIRFETQDSTKADSFIDENQQRSMTKINNDELGFAVYQIDLTTDITVE
ncbi:bifunctional 2',3'-cyclic-nucleotide 2'-phosphodiesterase/3'-nucleotidase [Shewanella surugensis]|uniref:Bifunctional 2',3'-cyclic-nucleotide 2'-phosphodiesterase/3'-nucleotidase n=1 Tax=Shewanella surugensis TaxID=212020 RepID=A0ABT0LBW1_9GAMM|nr:bifunctional 2',3'-cyclic-nucleotide 2'-phosphodiesterase/3'-nucleotidase [Shewanella surugensis]MCL1124855.1 bifunctional 2',3'-cyclic-nucleotide 2'-phosphodiesterase/3'-nucleotidase [Shewanella surugensis]